MVYLKNPFGGGFVYLKKSHWGVYNEKLQSRDAVQNFDCGSVGNISIDGAAKINKEGVEVKRSGSLG